MDRGAEKAHFENCKMQKFKSRPKEGPPPFLMEDLSHWPIEKNINYKIIQILSRQKVKTEEKK